MATVSTVYDVRVKYMLDDRASRALGTIDRRARGASRSTGRLGMSLSRVAGIAGGAFGAKKILDWTVGYNRNMATLNNKMTTTVQMLTKVDRLTAKKQSSNLISQFREDAKESAGTLQDMAEFAGMIAPAVTKAGGSMETLREMTKGGVVAAAALGERADVAARDIKQALTRGVNARDPFAAMLLASVNMTTKAFNELDTAARLKTLQKAFNQPAIKEAAKEYQNSFEGVFSTFKMNLQEFGGKVGSKLFKRLTVELQRLNKWFDNNEKRVDEMAEKFADGMVKAFEMAKKVFMFLVEHKDLLIMLAKAWLLGKAVGGITGMFSQLGGGIGGFAQKLGGATMALGALAIGAQGIANHFLEKQEATIKKDVKHSFARERGRVISGDKTNNLSLAMLERAAKARGIVGDKGAKVHDLSTPEGRKAQRAQTKAGKFTAGSKLAGRDLLFEMVRNAGLQDKGKAASFADARKLRMSHVMQQQSVGMGTITTHAKTGKLINVMSELHNLMKMQGFKGSAQDIMKMTPTEVMERLGDKFDVLTAMLPDKDVGDDLAHNINSVDASLKMHAKSINESTNMLMAHAFKDAGIALAENVVEGIKPLAGWLFGDGKKPPEDPKGSMKIGKMVINVESNDPDRMALGLEGLFSDIAKNGAQAALAQRGF